MSTTPRTVADFETQLSTAISVGATTFSINSGDDDDGVALPTGLYCFTIDNGSSVKEYLMGTLTGTAVTAVQSISRQGVATTGAVRAHRVGASVIITDFYVIKRIADILSGDDTLDGTSPLSYDTLPTLSDPKELTTVQYVLDIVNGGTVNFSSQTISATAGETLSGATLPVWCYFKEADSRWWKVDTDDSATYENVRLGFAISTATAGNSVTIQLSGICSGFTGLSSGTKQYGTGTGGTISTSVTGSFVGWAFSTTSVLMSPNQINYTTYNEKQALAGGSTFGTPSSTNKYITQDYNASATGLPVVRVYTTAATGLGSSTTQFDITLSGGTTYRYTFDGTGTDPNFSAVNNPVGSLIFFQAQNFNAANNGLFVVTGSGSNYVEVTNASGVAESNKTIGTGTVQRQTAVAGTWTKPTGLKYITIKETGGGGDGGTAGTNDCAAGGGGAGYAEKLIAASALSSSEYFIVPPKLYPACFRTTSSIIANGGTSASSVTPGTGGTASGGDINITGSRGTGGDANNLDSPGGMGGSNLLGNGGGGGEESNPGSAGTGYGAGGGGGSNVSAGGTGTQGVIILTEYYS